MSNIIHLNLPKPSELLVNSIKECVANTKLELDNKRWLDNFHNNEINSVLHFFTVAPESITEQCNSEYQKYFNKHNITAVIGIMSNNEGKLACLPPHTDRARTLAINYYIELGGNNVITCFYDKFADTSEEAGNITYKDVGEIQEGYVFDQDWYAYNVNRFHSVEQIETNRVFLSIFLETNYSVANLTADYPELILPFTLENHEEINIFRN